MKQFSAEEVGESVAFLLYVLRNFGFHKLFEFIPDVVEHVTSKIRIVYDFSDTSCIAVKSADYNSILDVNRIALQNGVVVQSGSYVNVYSSFGYLYNISGAGYDTNCRVNERQAARFEMPKDDARNFDLDISSEEDMFHLTVGNSSNETIRGVEIYRTIMNSKFSTDMIRAMSADDVSRMPNSKELAGSYFRIYHRNFEKFLSTDNHYDLILKGMTSDEFKI